MTTAQIITITILSLIVFVAFIYSIWTEKKEYKDAISMILIFAFAMMTLLACLTTSEMMELRKNKSKCPEYEKIENVYRLKD
jgi:hypothetical protein